MKPSISISSGRFIALVLMLPFIHACTYIDRQVGQDFSRAAAPLLASVEPLGVDDVLAALGPPQKLSALPGGYVFLYQQFDIAEKQIGISSDRPLLKWFKLSLASADVDADTLVLQFDREDRLVANGFSSTREELGEGGSIMFALNFLSMIDSDRLDRDIQGPNRWGMSLLVKPQVALNRQNSVDSGQAGVELRGTPVDTGQRSLEERSRAGD